MAMRTGDGPPRRRRAAQTGPRQTIVLARRSMLQRFGRLQEGDEHAFDSADDGQLLAFWERMCQVIYGVSKIDWKLGVRQIEKLRTREQIEPAEVYDFLQWAAEFEEWGHENVDGWTPSSIFVLCSEARYRRYTGD